MLFRSLDAAPALATQLESMSAINLKRVWIEVEHAWLDAGAQGDDSDRFLRQATQVKNIWVPYGT